jgi:hypothetical protein
MMSKRKHVITTAYYFNGSLCYARRAPLESPLNAIARSTSRRLRSDVTIWYDHAATLDRGDGHHQFLAKWYDATSETFREASIVVEVTS